MGKYPSGLNKKMPITIPDNLEPLLNVEEENNSDLQKLADKHDAVLLALIAGYVPERISPSQFLHPSLGLGEEFGVNTAIEHIQSATKCKKLFLAINSLGGGVASSYKIARALRRNFDDITVFVPHIAASGGTLITLCGNKIVMGEMSQLSPIDPQLQTSKGYIALSAFQRAFSRLTEYFEKKEKSEAPYPWVALTDKIDPIQLETYIGEVDTIKFYATQILGLSNPKVNKVSVAVAGKFLAEGFGSHSTVIDLEFAQMLGLPAVGVNGFESEWSLMSKWVAQYLLKSERKHFIRCVVPSTPTPPATKQTTTKKKVSSDSKKKGKIKK